MFKMDPIKIEISCPKCNRKFKEKVKNIRLGKSRRCPFCSAIIEFKGDDMRKIQKEFDDFEKTIDKSFSKLKF